MHRHELVRACCCAQIVASPASFLQSLSRACVPALQILCLQQPWVVMPWVRAHVHNGMTAGARRAASLHVLVKQQMADFQPVEW